MPPKKPTSSSSPATAPVAPSPAPAGSFLSLVRLLFQHQLAHGTLASAIEQTGVFSWDRYGRFRHFEAHSPEALQALELLARTYAASLSADGSDLDGAFFDEESLRDSGGENFGWPAQQAPDFATIAKGLQLVTQPRRSQSVQPKTDNANLAIILALLRFIKGELNNRPHSDYSSEAQLIEQIAPHMVEYPWVSVRNLKDKFARAKNLIPRSEL